ncbi:MAG: hypothetical protein ACOCOR_03240 [Prevotella sp.]
MSRRISVASSATEYSYGDKLGLAYVFHYLLWAPIGMRWAWNYFEGYVFGCPTSGAFIPHPIITSRLIGPAWMAGGAFGSEALVVAI